MGAISPLFLEIEQEHRNRSIILHMCRFNCEIEAFKKKKNQHYIKMLPLKPNRMTNNGSQLLAKI